VKNKPARINDATKSKRLRDNAAMTGAADNLDQLIDRLERAAEQLRSGELSPDAAATLVEDCAALAGEASVELEQRARVGADEHLPAQDTLL
jgi:hypothetical protein